MNRPTILHVGGTLNWTIRTRNPDTQILKDADSTPTVAVRKNGASTVDSVTITKRASTTGIYDCSYNPAGEIEGDEFTIEETATVTGTTTGSATYSASWEFSVVAVERGTDSALTTAPPTAAAIADAVWDEARTGHMTSGTFGFYLDAAISGVSGGGGGDATLAKQEEILDAIDAYFSQVLATVDGTADTIVGFPATLTIGNSYTTDGGNAIHVFIRDENDVPITSVGTHNFTDPDFSCDLIITNSGNAGRVRATVTYVDPGVAESYLKVEIPLSESSRAAAGAATMQCTLKWDGVAKTIATQTVTWVARI